MRDNVSSSDCHAFAIMLEISAASTCSLVHEVIACLCYEVIGCL